MSLQTPKSLKSLSLAEMALSGQIKIEALSQFILSRDAVPHAELDDGLRSIGRRFERFSLKSRVLDLYTNNRIHLLGNRETVKIPTMIPAWRMAGANGAVVAYINAAPYVPGSGAANMDVRKLFGLLVLGAVLVDSYAAWPKVAASGIIAKEGAAVYSRTLFKVVDRVAGVGIDRLRSDQVKYVFAKYFLVNLLGRSPTESTDALALGATAGTAKGALADFEAGMAEKAGMASQAELYAVPPGRFIEILASSAPWLSRLSFRTFLQTFTSMYNPAAILMVEDATYMIGLMATHQAGAEILSSYSFDPVYGNEGDAVVDEFARLVR